jgi:hypothetical protein
LTHRTPQDRNSLLAGFSLVLVFLAALLLATMLCNTAAAETVVDVYPGDDLDAKANSAPAGATIQVHSKPGVALYVYTVDDDIDLQSGQTLIGDAGTVSPLGPANVPKPTVGMKAAKTSMDTMMQVQGDPIRIAWLDIDVNGAQKAMNGLAGGENLQMDHVVVHGAQASGIGQYRGFVLDSELYNNGTNPRKFGGTVAGVKCNYACEVARSYVHDNNSGNGIWCDVGCQSASNQPNGFYVHDNIVGNNGRHGIFYENAPKPNLNPGDSVEALIQNNRVYGSRNSGISVSDAANGKVDSNILAERLDGTILHNYKNMGVELHSSGDPGGGIQRDAVVSNNTLNGEIITGRGTDPDGTRNTGCGDNGNVCINNN